MKLVALALILLSALSASAQDQQARLDTLRAEGYEALYNLDYETARSRFKKMIDLAPDQFPDRPATGGQTDHGHHHGDHPDVS